MKVLVVGSGAREHALAWKLKQSPQVDALFAAPGNAGTAQIGTNWPELTPTAVPSIVAKAAAEKIDLAVIGPEAALAASLADGLRAAGIAAFGPGRDGARLESSKAFAKQFMSRWGIPTPRFLIARDAKQAKNALRDWPEGLPVVVKADGLAAGKGVVVCQSLADARSLVEGWYAESKVPGGGSTVVFEEKLDGDEASVMAVVDGRRIILLPAARDYKRAGDADTGPNTGGMGGYSPADDVVSSRLRDRVYKEVFVPALAGLQREEIDFRGCLYAGLMITSRGPVVLEFNVRFGDPEAQVLLPRFEGDLAELLNAAARQRLEAGQRAEFSPRWCVGVVLASDGYPATSAPVDNLPIPDGIVGDGISAFWGNSKNEGSTVRASGGRVLTLCALGDYKASARAAAYAACAKYSKRLPAGTKLWYRGDIAR